MQISFESKQYRIQNDDSFASLISQIRLHKIPSILYLRCENHTSDGLTNFYNKLSKVAPPLVFAVKLVDANGAQIYEFEKIKFAEQLKDKIEQLKTSISEEKKTRPKISTHKLAMLARKGKSIPEDIRKDNARELSTGRIRIPQAQRRVISLPKISQEIEAHQSPIAANRFSQTLYQGRESELINLHNIETHLELLQKYQEFFSNEPRPTLKQIWEAIVGKCSEQVANTNSTIITDIHKDVMIDFMRNYPKLKHGVFINSLPVVVDDSGKIIKVVKYQKNNGTPQKNILKYESVTQQDQINLFSPVFTQDAYNFPSKEAYESTFPTSDAVTQAINSLFSSQTGINKTSHVIKLACNMLKSDTQEKNTITRYITKFADKNSDIELLGLTDIIVASGIYALFMVLKLINGMDHDLVKDLLTNRENYIQFASQDGLDKLSSLARLDAGDKIWWQELVKKHKKSGDRVDFFELFELFNEFRSELGISEGALPTNFPFKNIEDLNMKSALNIAKSIIKNTKNPMQLYYLEGIGLDLTEAYFASQTGKFRIITKEMGLQVDKAFAGLNYSVAEQDFSEIMYICNHITDAAQLQTAYELHSNYFYRFIARNDLTSPKRFKYESFLAIREYIDSLNNKLIPKVDSATSSDFPLNCDLNYKYKSSLLYIAAVAGTGKGADKQALAPNDELKKFIQSLRVFADKLKVENLEDIIDIIHNVGLDVKTCPSLSEISEIINKLSASNTENWADLIQKTFEIIKFHGEEAVEIFANFSEIINKSKTQNSTEGDNCSDIYDLITTYATYDLAMFNNPEIKPFLAKTLAIFTQKIRPEIINHLNPSQQKFLFQKLATIDLSKTNCLLTVDIFEELVDRVRGLSDEKALHTEVQTFFIEKQLDIKFNSSGVSRSKISLKSALESLISFYNESYTAKRSSIDTALNVMRRIAPQYIENIRVTLDEINSYIKEIEEHLKSKPVDEQAALKIFDKADLRLAYLKDDLIKNGYQTQIDYLKTLVLNCGFIPVEDKPYTEAYFETYSLAVFMDKAINLSVKETIDTHVKDVFGENDKSFTDPLMEYISDGNKPVRFGMIRSIVDPTLGDNSKEIKELLQNVDGLILYNDTLYYIQQNKPLKVIKLKETDETRTDANLLKRKITDKYTVVGADGFRIIKLDKIGTYPNTTTEESLYKHVRTMSLSQDAIICYRNQYYYFDFIAQVVTLQTNGRLAHLFVSDFANREASSSQEKEIFKEVIGQDKLHNELALISRLGIEPTIFPSQKIEKYSKKLDKFTDVLNKLEELKEKNPRLFNGYFKLLKALQEKVSVNDLINVLDLLMTLMPLDDEENQEPPSLVLDNLKLLYNKILDIPPVTPTKTNLSSLVSSLEKLSKNKLNVGENLKDLLENLIPFALTGAEFPLDIFLKNQNGQDKEFLKNLLNAAATLSNSGETDFFENLERIKNIFPGQNIEPILSTLLTALVQDTSKIAIYKEIYTKLSNIESSQIHTYVEIFKALSSLSDTLSLEDINQIFDGIKNKEVELERVYKTFFKFEPYLDKVTFLEVLNMNADKFDKYLKFYDRHPYKEENLQKMHVNFGMNRVLDVIDGIIRLPNNVPLSYEERVKLTKEFSYVNAISTGQIKLHLRAADGSPIEVNGKSSFSLHEYADNDDVVSREELILIAQKLKEAFYASESINANKEYLSNPANIETRRLALQYIAVMREVYYRTTKIVPNSTQIITIINALNNPGKQLEEIETAEGKSVTTALFSALLCAKGCTVLVPTSSKSLVTQDYLEKHNDLFFKMLGFESKIIDQEQDNFKLNFGGINYGTSRDLDSLIAEYKITGLSLTTSEIREYPLACVKDEQDNDLDDLASRTIAIEFPVNKQDLSPTWIVSAINTFVESENYQNIEKIGDLEPDDEEQDIRNLIRYLRTEACANKDDRILASQQVDDFLPFLKDYLAIACEVQGYKEGIDYQVIDKDLEGESLTNPIATPVNPITSEVERGNIFPDSRQAFLHDILNRSNKYPGRTFEIKIDPIEIDIKSNKSLAEDFDYFIGLSATSGSKQEILEVGMPVNKIPPHTKKIRKTLSPQAVKTEDKHNAIINAVRINGYESDLCPTFVLNVLVSIAEICQKTLQILCYIFGKQYTPKDKQPILIFVNDLVEAKELHDKFSKINNGYNLQFSNGTETSEEYQDKIKKAGEKNTLTIVVPKDGRGIDYDSEYPEGIFGIKAFNSNLRGGVQVLGRIGRKGKPGKFLEIVDGGEFEYNSLYQRVFGISHQEKKQQVQKREDKLNKDRALERQERQQKDAKIQVVLQQFDKIRLELNKAKIDYTKLLLLRSEFLRSIKVIEKKKLNIKNFQASLILEWNKFVKKEMKPFLDKSGIESKVMKKIKFHLDEKEIRKQFIFIEIEHHATSSSKQRIKKISSERTKQILEQYLDGSQAMLEFDDKFVEDKEKIEVKLSKAVKQLKYIFENYKWLELRYDGNDDNFLDNYYKLLAFDYSDSYMQFYPIALEMLDIYEDVNKCMSDEQKAKVNDKLEELKKSFNLDSMNENIFKDFKKQLNFFSRGLYLLGVKSPWFSDTYNSLEKLIAEGDIDKLYRELYKTKTLLANNSSIFPFASYLLGTYDLNKLIQKTLEHIDSINDKSELRSQELNMVAEKGQCAGLFEAYLSKNDLQELRNKVPDNMKSKWDSLIECINGIRTEQPGFAAVEEILALFNTTKIAQEHYVDGQSLQNPSKSLFFSYLNSIIYVADSESDPKKCLIKKLEKIQSKIRELEKSRINTLDESLELYITQDKAYLDGKQEKLKRNINKILEDANPDGAKIDFLEILPGYFGNSKGYELRIKYNGDIFANPTFTTSLGSETDYLCVREDVSANQDSEDGVVPEIAQIPVADESKETVAPEKPTSSLLSIFSLFYNESDKKEQKTSDRTSSFTMPSLSSFTIPSFTMAWSANKPAEAKSDISPDASSHSDSLSQPDIHHDVVVEQTNSKLDPELERQAIIVKKFDSLTALLEFEINFLDADDPRHRNLEAVTSSAHAMS